MEKLFAITLLTLISVIEIVYMLMGTMLPIAAVLIALVLLLVFMMVFKLGSRHFWRMISFICLINLLIVLYLSLKLGISWPILLALVMVLGALIFSEANANRVLKRQTGYRTASVRSRAPEKKSESHTANLIESYIKSLDEKELTRLKDGPEKLKTEKPRTVVRKKFTHGKYLASKNGRQYHKPRCDWANNIRKENQLWFASAEEAEKKGYTRHSCLN